MVVGCSSMSGIRDVPENFSLFPVPPWRTSPRLLASARELGARTRPLAIDLLGRRSEAMQQRLGQRERHFPYRGVARGVIATESLRHGASEKREMVVGCSPVSGTP